MYLIKLNQHRKQLKRGKKWIVHVTVIRNNLWITTISKKKQRENRPRTQYEKYWRRYRKQQLQRSESNNNRQKWSSKTFNQSMS